MAAATGMSVASPQAVDSWRIAALDSAVDERVHVLFQEVFGVAKTPQWWSWKYAGGRGLAMGAWKGGALVAHYAGFPRRVYWEGRGVPALQVGDVMVRACSRGILTRRGAFQRCAAAFLERYLGYGRPYLLGFGFPGLRALEVAERLGLYRRVDRMRELFWPALPDLPRWRSRVHPLRPQDATLVDTLWRRMARDLPDAILGIRDWNYFQHRYRHHPEHVYHAFVVSTRFGGGPLGIVVLRRERSRCLWVDWVGSPEGLAEGSLQARRLAGRLGKGGLITWGSGQVAERMVSLGAKVTPLEVFVPANTWTDGPDPGTLQGRWWLTPGDTDFF